METPPQNANESSSSEPQKPGTIFATFSNDGKIEITAGDLTIEFCPAPDETREEALAELNRILSEEMLKNVPVSSPVV